MTKIIIPKKSETEIVIFEKGNDVFTTSLDIAEKFGKRHEYVVKKIERIDDLDGFTAQTFLRSEFKDSSGRVSRMYNITRDGFAFLAMGFTGKEGDKWKVKYIRAFNNLIELVQNSKECNKNNINDAEWEPLRIGGKIVRKDFTDAIKQLKIYALQQGSKSPEMLFTVYSKLVNQLFEFNDYIKTQKNKRDYMTRVQLAELASIESRLMSIIYDGIDNKTYYKDIYLKCKEKIDKYVELFGKTPVTHIQLKQEQYQLLSNHG